MHFQRLLHFLSSQGEETVENRHNRLLKYPLNGVSLLQTSCCVRLTASKLSLLIMAHSSNTKLLVCLNNSAVFLSKLLKSLSFIVIGILNLECAVLPLGISVDAMLDDTTVTMTTILVASFPKFLLQICKRLIMGLVIYYQIGIVRC